MTYRIELDRVRKDSNGSEWRWVPRATCGDMIEVGDHRLIVTLCKRMLAAGMSGEVAVFRGEMPCFEPLSMALWGAGGRKTEQPAHLRSNGAKP